MEYNICILILNSPNIGDYGHTATIINKLYANKYNYDFIVERCPLKEDLNKDHMWNGNNEYLFVWSKPSLIKKHLINYDYLFFIDSDAIFVNHEKTIDSFIDENFTNETCLILGSDCITKNYCFNKDKLNTGVIIAKNTDKTFEILDNWIKAPNTELCHEWKYKHTREQECLYLVKNKYNYNEINIVDYYKLNGIDGIWIKHYMGIEHDKRCKILNLYLKKFLIEYNIYDNSNIISTSEKTEKEKLICNQNKYCIIVNKDKNNINAIINYIYATIYGYDFIITDTPNSINKYVTYYDYLLIIDNSNIININYKIQDLINNNNEDIIIINDKNYLIKTKNKTKITKNITNNIWFNNDINFNLLNELLLKFNYINDIDYNIDTINDNINNMNNEFCNKFINNTNNKKDVNKNKYSKLLLFLIIFIVVISIFLYINYK